MCWIASTAFVNVGVWSPVSVTPCRKNLYFCVGILILGGQIHYRDCISCRCLPWLRSEWGKLLGVYYASYGEYYFFRFVGSFLSVHNSPGRWIHDLLNFVHVPEIHIVLCGESVIYYVARCDQCDLLHRVYLPGVYVLRCWTSLLRFAQSRSLCFFCHLCIPGPEDERTRIVFVDWGFHAVCIGLFGSVGVARVIRLMLEYYACLYCLAGTCSIAYTRSALIIAVTYATCCISSYVRVVCTTFYFSCSFRRTAFTYLCL